MKFEGRWHHIDDAGINPLPIGRRIPIWFGGHHDLTLRRIAKWGDGWMMNAYPAGAAAEADFTKLRAYAEEAGRDPDSIGVEVWVSTGAGDEKSWREESSSGRARASLTSRSTAPSSGTITGASPRARCRPI